MMIDDQHLSSRLHRSGNRPMGSDAAINSDDQVAAFVLKPYQRRKVGAVAFTEAVGDMHTDIKPKGGQCLMQQRRRASTIDIIITENTNFFTSRDSRGKARHGGIEISQHRRVGHQVTQFRIKP